MRLVGPIVCGLLVALTPAFAHAELEHEVKAAYLFKFLSYVEWPEGTFRDEETPIVVGTLGAEDVRVALQAIVPGRLAQGHPVHVRAFRAGELLSGMHVLFVARAETAQLPKLSSQAGLLLVSESKNALDQGAMVNLVRVKDRIRFEVAPTRAARAGLRISSRMLAVAQSVKMETP